MVTDRAASLVLADPRQPVLPRQESTVNPVHQNLHTNDILTSTPHAGFALSYLLSNNNTMKYPHAPSAGS